MESQWRSAAFSFLTHSIIKVIDLLHKNIARGKIQSRNRPVILEVSRDSMCGGMDSSSIAMLVNEINAGQASSLHTFTSTFPGDSSDAGVPPLGTGGTGRCPTPGQSDMSTTGEERRTGAGALPSIRV